jgi:hypothetical protein
MLRQILKRIAIRSRDYASAQLTRESSSDGGKNNFQVKINEQNETFELHETEVETASGKQKKFEFPFVYLRDNCQVRSIKVKT